MKKGNKDPSPMVQLSVEDTTKESKVGIHLHRPSEGLNNYSVHLP